MRSLLVPSLVASVFVVVVFACGGGGSDGGASSGVSSSNGRDAAKDATSRSDGTTSSSSSSSSSSSGGSSTSSSGDSGADTGPPGPVVTVTTQTVKFHNKQRTYLIAVPTDYDSKKSYPLVLSFHGNPGTAQDQQMYLPFENVSKGAAIVAYPQGDGNNWDLYTDLANNADMNWIAALPGEIATTYNIDKTRVFGFGFSGGGFFLPQFTCLVGGVFKAISANSGGGPDESQLNMAQYDNGCYKCPGGPVPALVIHGTNDTVVLPSSGDFTHACYATFNGCADTLSATTPSPCQQHDGCPAGKPVKWCLIPGLQHAAWSQAMTASWDFFTALP